MFYDVLDISATPMKCSCPFPFPETNVLIFENVQMIMFDEELKGKVTGMCEVLILVQSVCKSQRTLSHPPTPPHPATRDVSKRFELQVSDFPSRTWDLCQLITPGLALLLWIAARNSLVSACESGEQWGRALYFLSCAEMEVSRMNGWNQTKWRTRCISAGYTQKIKRRQH